MPVLEQVDQQTQMIQQLMKENHLLKESNENLKGAVNDMTQQSLQAAQQTPQAPQQTQVSGNLPQLVKENPEALVGTTK